MTKKLLLLPIFVTMFLPSPSFAFCVDGGPEYCLGHTISMADGSGRPTIVKEMLIDTTYADGKQRMSGAIIGIIVHEVSHVKNENGPAITGRPARPDPEITDDELARYGEYRDEVIKRVMQKYGNMTLQQLDAEFRKTFRVGGVQFLTSYNDDRKRVAYLSAIIAFGLMSYDAPELLQRNQRDQNLIMTLGFTNHIEIPKPSPEKQRQMLAQDQSHADKLPLVLGVVERQVTPDGFKYTIPKDVPVVEQGKSYPPSR